MEIVFEAYGRDWLPSPYNYSPSAQIDFRIESLFEAKHAAIRLRSLIFNAYGQIPDYATTDFIEKDIRDMAHKTHITF